MISKTAPSFSSAAFSAVQERGIGAVGDENAELAAFEALRPVLDDAERRRRIEILRVSAPPHRPASASASGRACRPTLRASVSSMLSRCDTIRSRMTGVFDLAQFEGQRGGDVVLLRRGLADEELPRLAVVVGEAFRRAAGPLALPRHRRTIGKPRSGDSRGPSPNEFGW